jgi:hypothetical protein
VADFQAVAAGIFKKGGVVGFVLPTRAFEVPSAGAGGDERESVEFGRVLHPECDPAFIRHVAGGFRHSKKGCGSAVWGFGFVLQPAGNLRLPCESEGWQQRFVKRPGFREAVYAKIDVVVKARHGRYLTLL